MGDISSYKSSRKRGRHEEYSSSTSSSASASKRQKRYDIDDLSVAIKEEEVDSNLIVDVDDLPPYGIPVVDGPTSKNDKGIRQIKATIDSMQQQFAEMLQSIRELIEAKTNALERKIDALAKSIETLQKERQDTNNTNTTTGTQWFLPLHHIGLTVQQLLLPATNLNTVPQYTIPSTLAPTTITSTAAPYVVKKSDTRSSKNDTRSSGSSSSSLNSGPQLSSSSLDAIMKKLGLPRVSSDHPDSPPKSSNKQTTKPTKLPSPASTQSHISGRTSPVPKETSEVSKRSTSATPSLSLLTPTAPVSVSINPSILPTSTKPNPTPSPPPPLSPTTVHVTNNFSVSSRSHQSILASMTPSSVPATTGPASVNPTILSQSPIVIKPKTFISQTSSVNHLTSPQASRQDTALSASSHSLTSNYSSVDPTWIESIEQESKKAWMELLMSDTSLETPNSNII